MIITTKHHITSSTFYLSNKQVGGKHTRIAATLHSLNPQELTIPASMSGLVSMNFDRMIS